MIDYKNDKINMAIMKDFIKEENIPDKLWEELNEQDSQKLKETVFKNYEGVLIDKNDIDVKKYQDKNLSN